LISNVAKGARAIANTVSQSYEEDIFVFTKSCSLLFSFPSIFSVLLVEQCLLLLDMFVNKHQRENTSTAFFSLHLNFYLT
jgi:hypothetical protein